MGLQTVSSKYLLHDDTVNNDCNGSRPNVVYLICVCADC